MILSEVLRDFWSGCFVVAWVPGCRRPCSHHAAPPRPGLGAPVRPLSSALPGSRRAGLCLLLSVSRVWGCVHRAHTRSLCQRCGPNTFSSAAFRLWRRKPLPQGLPSAPDSRCLMRVTQAGRRASPAPSLPQRPEGQRATGAGAQGRVPGGAGSQQRRGEGDGTRGTDLLPGAGWGRVVLTEAQLAGREGRQEGIVVMQMTFDSQTRRFQVQSFTPT